MSRLTLVLALCVAVLAVSTEAVRPQKKLYFTIPLGPAPAPAAAPAATTAAAAATTGGTTGTGTTVAATGTTAAAAATTAAAATSSQWQLSIVPLGALLASFLQALFPPPPTPATGTTALQIVPLGYLIGQLFGGIFGTVNFG